ncbi:TetR/AcrR family transcriptional regulator [Melissospora conviva]|uniref:TetR/AcrR family transcriptional regulator n=1 Tax=Melissospora conviva TaxID=3388432 RepID=UPI003C1501C1
MAARPVRIGVRSGDEIRRDLTTGLAEVLAEKGYAGATIAEIVAHARVSKRTFYEHFADKEECLMALYSDASAQLMNVLRSGGRPDRPWREQVEVIVTAYLALLDAVPAVSRIVLVEMQAAGARAYRLRQRSQLRVAETLVEVVEAGRPANPEVAPLTPQLAIALVGGLNELLLQVVDPYRGLGPDSGRPESFMALRDSIVRLVSAVLTYRG